MSKHPEKTSLTPTGEDRIRELIEEAETYVPPPPDPHQPLVDRDELDLQLTRMLCNDLGNALRFRLRHGTDFLYVRDDGWYAWTGTHWSRDEGAVRARKAAHATIRAIWDEVAIIKAKATGLPETDRKAMLEVASNLSYHAIRSGSAGSMEALLRVAAPYLEVPVGVMDANPFLFAVQNGVLELSAERIRLRPHRRDDRITKVAPVIFDAAARAPQFDEYLARSQPDAEAREGLQRYYGYALTGSVREQVLIFNYGAGGNGKSVLQEVMRRVMGPYATILPFASVAAHEVRGGSGPSPDIARLPGVRLVTASEPEPGTRFSEGMIKQLTGGEKILARHLREAFFEYAPQFKIVLSGNEKPVVRGIDEGIWRRLLLVPWPVIIPRAQRISDLDAKLYEEEGPGIFNWLLEGCRLWLESGLLVPDSWRAATDEYRAESDALGEFLKTRVARSPGNRVPTGVMYRAYEDWAKQEGERKPMTRNAFGRQMSKRGFRRETVGVAYYMDVELVEAAEQAIAAEDDLPPP
jgi:putative DNA primase/helicase